MLDPLSLIINSVVGLVYCFARRYDESIANHKKVLEMDPNFLLANTYIVHSYMANGNYTDAVDIGRKAEPLAAEHAYSLCIFGAAYGLAGLRKDALRILANLEELAQRRYVPAFSRMIVLMGMGKIDEALNEMEKSIEERFSQNIFTKTHPYFDGLKSNKRFQLLLKEIGLNK